MQHKTRPIIFILICIFVFHTYTTGSAEKIGMGFFLTGETADPVTVSFFSPEYRMLAQYGADRLENLNRLLRHISIHVKMDHTTASETAVCIDEEPVFAVTEETVENRMLRSYSVAQAAVFETNEAQEGSEAFSFFLDSRFFTLNRYLDDLYAVFEKAADAFPDLAGSSAANLSFSGFGKAVRRITIPFNADYVKEHFPGVIADLCDTAFCRGIISSLIFHGAQKIVLLFDKEDHLIRINYDGVIGKSEQSMRKVSLVWKCMRTDGRKKDSMTLKTPAMKGYDKDNIAYDRDLDCSDPLKHILKWDYQLDMKAGQEKEKTHYNGDLLYDDGALTGKILYSNKNNSQEQSIALVPSIRKEKEDEYSGTLEITKKKGKIIKNSFVSRFSISTCNIPPHKISERMNTDLRTDLKEEDIQLEAIRLLVRKMIMLPKEDTVFLNQDIPDDIWNTLTESLI